MEKNKAKKIGIVALIITLIIGLVIISVNADNSKSYVVDVVNAKDTEEDAVYNDKIKIHKQIVKDSQEQPYYNDKNLTYQVSVSNVKEAKTREIALVIDTSYSTSINDEESLLKTNAIELVKKIYQNCPNSKIQLFNAEGSKTNKLAYNTTNLNTMTSTINSLVTGDGNNIENALNAVKTSFTAGDDIDKYVIIFSDATDNTKEVLSQIDSNDIKIISVSVNNISSNSYEDRMFKMIYSSSYTDEEKAYDELNMNSIVNIINESLLNIEITDTFAEALQKYFDFELISTSENNNLQITNTGYTWNIDCLKAGESKTLKYKLNIKEGIEITDTQYKYHILPVSQNIVANYEQQICDVDENIKETLEVNKENIPTITICEKYTVTFKAVSEENNNLPIEGIEFKVVATDLDGNVVYNQTLTTDSEGKIIVDNLKTEGLVHFEVKPSVNINGYDSTDTTEIEISNHNGTGFVVETPEYKDQCTIEEDRRNVTVNIPIKTQKFTLKVALTELNNSNSTIGNTEFRLIQPKLNNKYDLEAKYGETDSNGNLIFNPTIMTKAGTYEYILSQMTVQDGYISMGNATLRITFDGNGNIPENGIKVVYNDNVTGQRIDEKNILITVKNSTEMEDAFNLELNLVDEDDSRIKLEGAEYDVEVTRVSSGKEVTTTYYNNKVNEKGKMLINLPGNGNIQLKITQVKAKTGYNIDTESKIVTLLRENGTVTEIRQAYNEDSKTSIDAKAYSSENKVIVNLSNKIKSERNIVNIKITDIEETDIVIPNVEVKLINNITKQMYTEVTDINGIARFQIDEEAGIYPYTIKVGELPNIYGTIIDTSISIEFNSEQHMVSISDLGDDNQNDSPLYEYTDIEAIDNEDFTDYTTNILLGATVSDINTYWFEIMLKDEDDKSIALEGASYDITITSGSVIRTITGRRTDSSGNIRTRITLNEDITIEVTQKESATRYKIDTSTKEIVLRYVNGNLSFAETEVENVVIKGNSVIYNHTNRKKTGNDVLLDLTINKEDLNGFAAGNIPIRIYQEKQKDSFISVTQGYEENGIKYGSWIEQSGDSDKPIALPGDYVNNTQNMSITTKTDNLGTVVLKGLKLNNIPTPGEAEFLLYVVEVDSVTGQDKAGTLVKYKITYRYNVNKEIVEITNVETTLGNRLVKEKTFNGYETSIGYQSNILTTIYANYEETGNLALDLSKLDKDGKILAGAEYKINVMRPDGSSLTRNVTVEDEKMEIQGLLVTEGSQIEITETKAPVGYDINEATEIIEVESIDETGEITLKIISNNYPTPRIEINKIQAYQTTSGNMKTEYGIKLKDYELDTFKIQITAKNAETEENIEGYSFKITSSQGAMKITKSTDKNGETGILVGGKYKNETITYNISKKENAEYYKDIKPFTLNVKFNEDEKVDLSTLNIQTDTNYGELEDGKTWQIKGINTVNKNDIEIEVYIKPEDPLEVEIETIDAISGNKLTNATYKIEPSVNFEGNGELNEETQNTTVKVGYVQKNASKLYTLKTTLPGNYETLPNQLFTVYYDDNGNIKELPTTTSKTMTITSYSGKKMTIRNVVEPKQGIQIVNKDYFTQEKITGAEFEVTTETGETKTVSMGLLGIGSTLGNKNGEANSTVKYKINQKTVSSGYATVPDFEIEVTYGQNREITNVELVNTNCQIWVNPTFILPSTNTDPGYNGNSKGIVKIEINSYYDFRINIENVDRLDNDIKIVGTNYKVTSTENANGTAQTNIKGIGTAHLNELKLSKRVVYTIVEETPSINYQPLEINQINVEVEFDEQGYVIPTSVRVLTGRGDEYSTASGIDTIVENTDKFAINLRITSNPKFRMKIKNIDYFDNTTLLNGTKYNITSDIGNSIDNGVTDSNGEVTLRVDGNPKNKVTYTIHEEYPSAGYQTLEEDIKVEVIFNEDGTVNECNIVQGNRFSSATPESNIVITSDNFAINVEIKSVELLKFNINNISEEIDSDRNPIVKQLAGAKYKITAIETSGNENLNINATGETDSNGLTTIAVNKALSNKTIKYTISQIESAIGYKTLDCDIMMQVSFDNDGKIVNESSKIIIDANGQSSNNFAEITSVDIDNFEINLKIKSNKKVSFIIKNISTSVDEDGTVTSVDPVVNTTYKISVEEASTNTNLQADNSVITGTDGIARISMDKGLANKTIRYTITQEKKTVGYNWIECEIIIETEFNAEGKIIQDTTKIISNNSGESANKFTTIKNVDIENYEIYLEIENSPIKEFGIHLIAKDIYTQEGINGVKANAYLAANDVNNSTLQSDNKYDFSVINKDMEVSNEDFKYLYTGADRNGDGTPDEAVGEDYLSMGEYLEGSNTSRVLRVILRDVPEPYQWYSNNANATQDFSIIVDLQFNDEGKIIKSSLRTGHNDYIGWLADERYVAVETTGYGLTIRLNFYPMLYVKMESQDMYTDEILESTLNLSTSTYPKGMLSQSDMISEGYIGTRGQYATGAVYSVKSNHEYVRAAKSEANRERYFYLYEETIPREKETYYQKYRPRTYPSGQSYYSDTLIGVIKVTYDEAGKIKDAQVAQYRSGTNITSGYIDLKWDGYKLSVKVKYVPTTKMVATIVDRVTGATLNNIKIYPFNQGQIRYQYIERDEGYETTSSIGEASWTYWKANIAGTQNTYVLNTVFNGVEYDGYYLPGNVKLDVAYNEIGRITSVQVLSQNIFQDALNAEARWEDSTVYVTIKLDRKFNLKIDKKDIYNSNKNLNVKFNIESNKHETASINAWKTTTVGRVHAGDTVEYTLSEETKIDGYLQLKNLKVYVEFDTDGTVIRAYVDKNYEKYFEVLAKANAETGKKGINTTDLEIIVKNTPTFSVDLELSDAFYSNLKLSNATFTMTNDKGDSASGNLVTDAEGKISTIIGEMYPNENVTYTLKQTNTVNGYFENSVEMKFTVHCNENGYIDSYTVINGNDVFTIEPEVYNGKRNIKLEVKNQAKDINIGIVNLDDTTNQGINDITYQVEITDTDTNQKDTKTYITKSDINGEGTVSGLVDYVEKTSEKRSVKYKISEITIPNTYRKIQDVEIEVIYNEDGSIYSYDLLSELDDSGITVQVFRKGQIIQKLNGIPVHIKITIRNDNRYDLIIKNEDTNYEGLGIEGTKYDVSINGVSKNASLTNENGITGIYKIDGSGLITIRIAENGVGTGYRSNNENDTTIVLEKGETEYSLNFINNTNQEKADVVVNEERGTVTVTFKNETKLQLDLIKNNIKTEEALSNVPFEITSQEIDSNGNTIGDISTLTETGVNDTTNEEGRINFDLGVTPQNKTVLYTFKELETPEGFDAPIKDVQVKAKFDMYGQLQELTDNSPETVVAPNSNNVNGIVTIIGNKPTDPNPDRKSEYKVKIAVEDITTNRRLNGSTLDITMSKDDGTEFLKMDAEETGDISKNGLLIEKGAIEIDELTEEGNININIDQISTIEGYTYSHKTSGTVKINVNYEPTDENIDSDIFISLIDNDGFDVTIDNSNREIIIKFKNTPGVTLNINKYYESYEKDKNNNTVIVEKPAEGIKFEITSEIQTSSEIITTDLNKTTNSTDENGKIKTSIGEPIAGKTVLYTLKEIPSEQFEIAEDIVLLVKYNTKGNIKYAEILSDGDTTQITNDGEGIKELSIKVKNIKTSNTPDYKIVLEKHNIEDGEYSYLIPDVEFQIIVEEEYGTKRTWNDKTDENGIIESAFFSGYGRTKITYTELTAAEGYEKDDRTHEIEFYREKGTGLLSPITSDENYELDSENNIIYIKPQNELLKQRYSLLINKIDALNNNRIINNHAIFQISMIETQQIMQTEIGEDGNPIEITEENTLETQLGIIETNNEGKAKLAAIKMPDEEGTYKIKISETKAPKGYKTNENGYFLNVTFKKNSNDAMEITEIQNLSEDEIQILKTNEQLIAINIKNERKIFSLSENEFALDVTKVDSETKEAITSSEAIFKLTDEKGNRSYLETDLYNGKVKIPYFQMPSDDEFKNKDLKPIDTVEKEYELQEIMAPEGYLVDTNPINIKITFTKDDDNKTIINNIKVSKEEKEKEIEIEVTEQNRIISFYIENTKGELINNTDRGKYTINIAKIDEETEEPITGHATFIVTLENGQKVTASTDENGNIQIKDIKVPSTVTSNLGPYSYVIEETKPADGYEPVDGFSILEITFKELTDPITGETTGLYGIDDIDKVPVLTQAESAIITSYTESNVNITISNNFVVYSVSYNANCDDETVVVPKTQRKISNKDLTLSDMTLIRRGYIFKGWAETPDAQTEEYKSGGIFTKDKDTILYAIWDIENHTIHYEANDSEEGTVTNMPEDQTKAYDEEINLSDKIPEREGYIFKGWTTTADVEEAKYQPGDSYAENSDVTLYAIWELKTYKIHYEANEEEGIASNIPEEQTKKHNEDIGLSDTTPERAGYTFKGWAEAQDATEAEYQPGDTFTKNQDTTLYAIWKIESYKIHYETNNNGVGEVNNMPDDQTKIPDEELILSDMTPTREGYVFDGWAETTDAVIGEYLPGDTYSNNSDLTLYAIWTEKIFLTSTEYQIIDAKTEVFGIASIGRKKIVYDTEQQFEYNEGDKFIVGILPQVSTPALRPEQKGTTVEKLKSNLTSNADSIKVYKKVWNNEELVEQEAEDAELVGTAMTIELRKGLTQCINLGLVVAGDVYSNTMVTNNENGEERVINGDGILKQNDQNLIITQSNYFAPMLTESGMAFVIALDMDLNGQINPANSSKYLEYVPKKSTTIIKSLFPWMSTIN